MVKLTDFVDYFRKIPGVFLVAIVSVLGLILFLPEETAKTLAVGGFRDKYRVYLGPVFLLTVSFCIARLYLSFMQGHKEKKGLKQHQEMLQQLTPEEKGYLVPFILEQKNSVYVGMDDGVMAGLVAKGITYRAASEGTLLEGFAHNLQPWARSYLKQHANSLDGSVGQPLTPQEKLYR